MPSRGLASCERNERGYGTSATGPRLRLERVEIDTPERGGRPRVAAHSTPVDTVLRRLWAKKVI